MAETEIQANLSASFVKELKSFISQNAPHSKDSGFNGGGVESNYHD